MSVLSALRFTVALYIVSESTRISYRLAQVANFPWCTPPGASLAEVLDQFVEPDSVRRLRAEADDWRPMTSKEIEEYEAAHA